jgi:hypothetical protein
MSRVYRPSAVTPDVGIASRAPVKVLSRFQLSAPPCRWIPYPPPHRTTRRAWNALNTNGCWRPREYSSYLQFKAHTVQTGHLSVENLCSHYLILYNTVHICKNTYNVSKVSVAGDSIEQKVLFFVKPLECHVKIQTYIQTCSPHKQSCDAGDFIDQRGLAYNKSFTIPYKHTCKYTCIYSYILSKASVTGDFIDQRLSSS